MGGQRSQGAHVATGVIRVGRLPPAGSGLRGIRVGHQVGGGLSPAWLPGGPGTCRAKAGHRD